jgi:hypothetical protein
MKPQEVLVHEWKEGEKLWAVYYKYNDDIKSDSLWKTTVQPIGVIEVTAKKVEWTGAKDGWFRSVRITLDADWGIPDPPYINTMLTAMITYGSGNTYYSNKEFCIDKFFDKKDAEMRYKDAVRNWNRKVKRFQASQKAKIEKAKEEYEKLLAAGVIDVDKYTIK